MIYPAQLCQDNHFLENFVLAAGFLSLKRNHSAFKRNGADRNGILHIRPYSHRMGRREVRQFQFLNVILVKNP